MSFFVFLDGSLFPHHVKFPPYKLPCKKRTYQNGKSHGMPTQFKQKTQGNDKGYGNMYGQKPSQ